MGIRISIRWMPGIGALVLCLGFAALSLCGLVRGEDRKAEPGQDDGSANRHQVRIEVFIRADSERCQQMLDLLATMQKERPGVRVVTRDVVGNQAARERFWNLARQHSVEKPVVPAVYLLNHFHVGFRDAESTRSRVDEALTLHAFVREGCSHCRDAKEFLEGLKARWPALRIRLSDVIQDRAALKWMNELAAKHRAAAVSLPCFYLCGRFLVGYRDDQTTGQQIERLLEEMQPPREAARPVSLLPGQTDMRFAVLVRGGPPRRIVTSNRRDDESHGVPVILAAFQHEDSEEKSLPIPDDAPPNELQIPSETPSETTSPTPFDQAPSTEKLEGIDVPFFGRLRVSDWGLPCFTLAIGLVDGFNPCAMWVLVFLLSILVNLQDRKKIVLIAGTFVIVSGLAYFAFMTAWLNVFQLIGLARPAQITLGLLALTIGSINVHDFIAFHRGISLSIPESAKPGIYSRVRHIVQAKYVTAALIGAATLAVFVNVVEILCTAGLPALYTQVLTLQQLPWWKNYLYIALYNVAYMFDDAVMVTIAVSTLSHRKMQEREGRWLKLISGVVILVLGLAMVFRPDWLS